MRQLLKEICPRGNNKVVIYISLYHDKYHPTSHRSNAYEFILYCSYQVTTAIITVTLATKLLLSVLPLPLLLLLLSKLSNYFATDHLAADN